MKYLIALHILLAGICTGFSQNWKVTAAPPKAWQSVAASADGRVLIAGGRSSLYVSTNAGATWAYANVPMASHWWWGAAASADGSKLFAADYDAGLICVSTNSGLSWTTSSIAFRNGFIVSAMWTSIACSTDGMKLAAVAYGKGPLYTSADGGNTWTLNTIPLENWESIHSSADGNRLAGVSSYGPIYLSSDAGAHWATGNTPTNGNWFSITGSADGNTLYAAVAEGNGAAGGLIWKSIDGGTNWAATMAPYANWQVVNSSSNGQTIGGVVYGGLIYTSSDAGTTWVTNNAPTAYWNSIACTADGSKFIAVNEQVSGTMLGQIYASYLPAPTINIAPGQAGIALSWVAPATNFTLQESFDLTGTNWTTLTNSQTTVNNTNQVMLSFTNAGGFFRLQSIP